MEANTTEQVSYIQNGFAVTSEVNHTTGSARVCRGSYPPDPEEHQQILADQRLILAESKAGRLRLLQ